MSEERNTKADEGQAAAAPADETTTAPAGESTVAGGEAGDAQKGDDD